MKHISHIIRPLLGLLLLLPAACTQDDLTNRTGYGVGEGQMSLQLVGAHMGIHKASRGSDAKEGDEQLINNAHIFVFDTNGNYLEPGGSNAFQGYAYLPSGKNLVLASSLYGDQIAAKTATVVAVANVPADEFGDRSGNHPTNIGNLSDLEQHVFSLQTLTVGIPDGGLPMVCIQEDVDLSEDATTKIKILNMRSMMARIDFRFTMDPFEESPSGNAPSLTFDEIYVGNFPMGGRIKPQLDQTTEVTNNTNPEIELAEETQVTDSELLNQTVRVGNEVSGKFYIFEHGRLADWTSNGWQEGQYPDSIADMEKQRYKNKLAANDAAYIRFRCTYVNHNDHPYQADYTIYPGGNPDDDFTIKTNCQYKNNVTITGITANHLGDEALLDTRVNIDTNENPYFIEMLRERKHDAHFNVTPMDVYIDREVSPKGTVTISIDDPENHTWIRMEPMRHVEANKAVMKKGRLAATEAGDGKRKYFTTDLLNELDQHDWSKTYTVGTDGESVREERIYFYIDENVPEIFNNGEDVPSREATITITFNDGNGNTETRHAPIVQAGMHAVYFSRNDMSSNYYFWIEEYEEYLEHYDGKDEYSDTYEGLEWGLDGVMTNAGSRGNYADRLNYGWRNTKDLMSAQRTYYQQHRDEDPVGTDDINLNQKPRSAVEYCYNKNKRTDEGKVTTVHWYLPTISECEAALKQWYNAFSVFQDKWYWSCNPGPSYRKNNWEDYPTNNNNPPTGGGSGSDIGENPDYARATKIAYANNGWTHVSSASDYPYNENYPDYAEANWNINAYPWPDNDRTKKWKGGYALRKEQFRIRAVYIRTSPSGNYPLTNEY